MIAASHEGRIVGLVAGKSCVVRERPARLPTSLAVTGKLSIASA
jgi:hypothetical protein